MDERDSGNESSNSSSDDSDSDAPPSPLPDGYNWRRYPMQKVFHTITIYCREKCIGDIRDILSDFGEDTLTEFKKSCFGHLLKLPENHVRNNHAIHYIISREIILSGCDPIELWFRVNNTNMRFSRFEYALVTGLRFGRPKFDHNGAHDISSKSFYSRVLKRKPILIGLLLERFNNKELGKEAADYVKVAKICFAYFVLFGIDSRKTIVSEWMWALVEDSKSFDVFPWGSYSYQILLHYLSNIRRKPTSAKRKSYHLYGFATAFLAWIYCAIPKLGQMYGGVISSDKLPRMLRFRYMRSNLEHENICGQIFSTLEPTEVESKKTFWKNIEPIGTQLKLHYRHCEPRKTNIKQNKIKNIEEDREEEQDEEAVEETQEDEDVVVRKTISKKTKVKGAAKEQGSASRRSHKKSKVVDESNDENEDGADHEDAGFHVIADHSMHAFSSPQRKSFVREVVDDVMSRLGEVLPRYNEWMQQGGNVNSCEDMNCYESYQYWETPDHETEENPAWTSSQTHYAALKKPWGLSTQSGDSWHASRWGTQWTNDSCPLWGTPIMSHQNWEKIVDSIPKSSEITPVAQASQQFTKPDFREIRQIKSSTSLLSPFCDTAKKGGDYKRFKKLKEMETDEDMRNVGIGYPVGVDFFKHIESFTKEMGNIHIDAYLSILHSQPLYCGVHQNRKDVVITSCSFMESIRIIWSNLHKEDDISVTYDRSKEEIIPEEDLLGLSAYVIGDLPKWGQPKPWYNYKKLVMVCHLPGHWVTCRADFETSSITVYDSFKKEWTDESMHEMRLHFTPLLRILPQVLKLTKFYEHHHSLNASHAKYT